jgi:hypothetical protein
MSDGNYRQISGEAAGKYRKSLSVEGRRAGELSSTQ